ncbi:MAG: DegT/DnrJ/EryC1/StrS family aminotransferase, partial [Chloroflexota bacterium]
VALSKVVIAEDEIAAVVEVLRSGNLREGPQCRAFETEFAAMTGSRHALTANSGTSALQMAYQAVLESGDEILVPSFTFFATASMALAVGAVPVFCDVDPDTFTIDVADAERRITARTRAIAPVHLFGNPAAVAAVQDLAKRHGLRVLWDAAQAHCTTYEGHDIGSLGDAVCYSFYPSKNMTTGEGGMVCTNDDELAVRMKLLRSQGQKEKYVHSALGFNFRMTDIQAAIGRGQLRKLEAWTRRRRQHAAYLRDRLAHASAVRAQTEQPDGVHSYHQFSIVLDSKIDREQVMTHLKREGVECAVHYPQPLHRQPIFAAGNASLSLPVSEDLSRHILSIPVQPHLSDGDVEYVADILLEAVS